MSFIFLALVLYFGGPWALLFVVLVGLWALGSDSK